MRYDARGRTVLVVDDEELIRWSLREGLVGRGYRVLEAGTGAEALALFQQGVDLVLIDLKLPDMDGLEVTERIRGLSQSCPVLLMTAYSTPEVCAEAARRAVLRIVEKPFDVGGLVARVERALAAPVPSQPVRG